MRRHRIGQLDRSCRAPSLRLHSCKGDVQAIIHTAFASRKARLDFTAILKGLRKYLPNEQLMGADVPLPTLLAQSEQAPEQELEVAPASPYRPARVRGKS